MASSAGKRKRKLQQDEDVDVFELLAFWRDARAIRRHMRETNCSYDSDIDSYLAPIYPGEAPDGETFDSVLERYEQHKEIFLKSQCWTSLRRKLVRYAANAAPIKNAICIALGSLSSAGQCSGSLDGRIVSSLQLAGFIAVVELLEKSLSGPRRNHTSKPRSRSKEGCQNDQVHIRMIAQEPRFDVLDKQLLQHLRVHIVPDPGAWNRISKHSMVYTPGAEAYHFFKVAKRKPAMWWPIDSDYLSYVEE